VPDGPARVAVSAISFPSVKRLTIVPPDLTALETTEPPPEPREAVELEERRKQPRSERRLDQRRRAIARRVVSDRRISISFPQETLFVESRSGAERRAKSARRKMGDRRAGVRLIDLTGLDLSELDQSAQ